jgi:hypothetical protein
MRSQDAENYQLNKLTEEEGSSKDRCPPGATNRERRLSGKIGERTQMQVTAI